jgi:hypothetical protein
MKENIFPVNENKKFLNKSMSNINSNSEKNNEYLNERSEYLKILKQFIVKYKFSDKTFYLSVLYLDIIMHKIMLKKHRQELKMNLMIIGCAILAAKFIENDPIIPHFRDISASSVKEIKKYEELCLKYLEYKLNYFTAYDFIHYFLTFGVLFVKESPSINNSYYPQNNNIYNNIENFNQQILNIFSCFVFDNKIIEYTPIQIACACISLARQFSKIEKWDDIFIQLYKIKFSDFNNCFEALKK